MPDDKQYYMNERGQVEVGRKSQEEAYKQRGFTACAGNDYKKARLELKKSQKKG